MNEELQKQADLLKKLMEVFEVTEKGQLIIKGQVYIADNGGINLFDPRNNGNER